MVELMVMRVGQSDLIKKPACYIQTSHASMSNTSLQPLTLHPWVYVLRCKPREGTNYPSLYVGATLNCHQRITQHFGGNGARFTQIHPPIAVQALHVDVGDTGETVLQREQRITLQHMRDYITRYGEDGWRSVAGAGYSMPHQMSGRPRDL